VSIRFHPWFKHWLLPGLVLGYLWFVLINHLRIEWAVNPQYNYGWAVPFLCLYLVYLRGQKSALPPSPPRPGKTLLRAGEKVSEGRMRCGPEGKDEVSPSPHPPIRNPQSAIPFAAQASHTSYLILFCLLAVAWLPIRLIQEANPEWRLVSWALALDVIGLTLLVIHFTLRAPSPPRPGTSAAWEAVEGIREVEGPSGRASGDERVIGNKGEVSIPSPQPFRIPHSAFRNSGLLFPLLFFLVAVPWPTVVEGPLIQWLTRANAACGIELLNLLGVPAVQHGNLIEVGSGVVGIDEACSGIRSFQATLMISLFFGQLYRLTVGQRILFVLAGFGLAFAFNVGRTTLLTWVAARDGVAAIDRWHDTAGVTILVACFISLYLLGLLLSRRSPSFAPTGGEGVRRADEEDFADSGRDAFHSVPNPSVQSSTGVPRASEPLPSHPSAPLGIGEIIPQTSSHLESLNRGTGLQPVSEVAQHPDGLQTRPTSHWSTERLVAPSTFRIPKSALAFLVWLLLSEISVESWYRFHEARIPHAAKWTVAWPTTNPSYQPLPFSEKTRQYLRHDEGANASWSESDGTRWQVIFLRWNPGKIAVHLAKSHTPQACLPASGRTVTSESALQTYRIGQLPLPFRHYVTSEGGRPLHVFYCLWEGRTKDQSFASTGLTWWNRFEPVLSGRRNQGQRSIELAVWGINDPVEAEAAVRAQLEKLIRVEK
jgi:exosortase/archaeosortase family protein